MSHFPIVLAQERTNQVNGLETFFNETTTYKNQNKINLVLESLDKAAALAEETEDVKALVDCYHKYALLYMELDKRETTLF